MSRTDTDVTAWLIEVPQSGGAMWWTGQEDMDGNLPESSRLAWLKVFSSDVDKAVQFRSEADAHAVLRLLPQCWKLWTYPAVITEHRWCSGPDLAAPRREDAGDEKPMDYRHPLEMYHARREDAAGARPNHCPDCGADRSLPITGPLSNPVDCMTCGRNAVATQAAGERLDQLAKLEWGWDSYGAPPIGKQAIDCARRLMAVLSHPPQIVPTSHGGVQLEWHREGVEVEITIPPEGGTAFYVDGER